MTTIAEHHGRRGQRGVALVLVLWILILVTVASSAFALMARADRLEAHALASSVRARLAAEGAIHLAAVLLRDPSDESRWIADGRAHSWMIDGIRVDLEITDERGKLDLNRVDENTLMQLFMGHGLEQDQAEELAAAIMDWRDGDDVERIGGAERDRYLAAGLEVTPADRPFVVIEELLQVLGMNYPLYRSVEPALSLWSGSTQPDAAFAPYEALLAVPDLTAEEAADFVTQRHQLEYDELRNAPLPGGVSAVAGGRGVTYSIVARATLPNGMWDEIRTTIRLGGTQDGRPFRTLRWYEGYHR